MARTARSVVLAASLAASCSNPPGPAPAAPAPETPEVVPTPTSHDDRAAHGHHGAMHHRFEDADEWAKAFDAPDREAWQKPDAVIAKLGLAADSVVADVGAGTGYFATRIARAVPSGKVIASDLEPDMVRYLKERADKESLTNLVAVEASSTDAALTEPVDLVFVCNTVHHIAARTEYFRALAGRIKPGGRVAVVDFLPDAPEDAPGPPKKHRIAPEHLAGELAAAGYESISTDTETLPYQYIAIFSAPGA